MINHTRSSLIGQRSLKLVTATFAPEDPPRAVVLLSHGYGEHMGRYQHVIAALVDRGYVVYSIDHRGHGASEGRRALVERFDYFVDDLHLLAARARSEHPDLPMFLLGHSMGGLIAFQYAVRYQHELAGLILSGPALASDVAPHLRRVARVLGTIVPWLPVAPLSSGAESALSRDPQVQELFNSDPLTYKKNLKAGMGYQMMRAMIDAEQHWADLTLPLLIMQGTADTIVNPVDAQKLYDAARSKDKTLKLWPDCRHEIFNELEKDQVIGYMLDWLDARVGQIAPAPPAEAVS